MRRIIFVTSHLARRPTSRAVLLLALLVAGAYGNVIFAGKSLVYSDNYNPLDYRALPENDGPNFEPPERWCRRSCKTA